MVNMLLGIGNSLHGDDGVGGYIARNLEADGWISVDCATVPENFTGIVRRHSPDLLVLVDAADMRLPPGEYRIVSPDLIGEVGIGTHALPLTHLIRFIGQAARTIIFVGVQPESLGMGRPLSAKVKRSAGEIIRVLKEGSWRSILVLEEEPGERERDGRSPV